jgi:anhydro-N-acetylmuramic acid kinase
VAHACREHLRAESAVDRVLVGGGGASNPALLTALRSAFPRVAVEPFDAVGVPAGAAEAMAFSLLGRNALLGLPNHLPRCTGAHRTAVLGEIAPAHSGRITSGR